MHMSQRQTEEFSIVEEENISIIRDLKVSNLILIVQRNIEELKILSTKTQALNGSFGRL